MAKGSLSVVGIGPGGREYMTLEAYEALKKSEVIAGYKVYINLLPEEFKDKETIVTGMRGEAKRCRLSLEEAAKGRTVSLICSGDAGVYGMASLVFELADNWPEVDIKIIPGVTAALSGSALLGSVLSNDFAVISLSDILTPEEKIIKRLKCAAEADLCIALYNPGSHGRPEALSRAADILLETLDGSTPVGITENISREGENCRICTLSELKKLEVNMFMTVFIGNSSTKVINGRLVTPRGYKT